MCNLYSITMAKDAMRQLFAVDAADDALGNAEPLTAIFRKREAVTVQALYFHGMRASRSALGH